MELTVFDSGEYKVLTITGKVDWENARELDVRIQKLVSEGARRLVFDLDNVTFLCSGAIGALTYNLSRIKAVQGAFYVISSNAYVNDLFETLHFDAVFRGMMYKSFDEFREKVLDSEGTTRA